MDKDSQLSAVFRIDNVLYCVKGRSSTALVRCDTAELKDYENYPSITGEFEKSPSEGKLFNFNLGPASGGILESVKLNVYTDGERITGIVPETQFKNRHIRMKGSAPDDALLKTERINGAYAAGYGTAFCLAAEDISGVEVDYDVQLVRMIMSELERVANHIHVIGKLSEGASQNVATYQLFALEERVRRIISKHFGHRFFYGVNGIGGLERAVATDGLSAELDSVVGELASIWDALTLSRMFLDRIQTTCYAKKPWTVGPVARAADFKFDTRTSGYLPYSDFGFEISSDDTGDVLSRALVRRYEIDISRSMIGEMCNTVGRVGKKTRTVNGFEGRAVKRVETPGGDMVMFLDMKNNLVTGFDIRSASTANMPAFMQGAVTGILTDFTFAWESFGFWISEMGGYQ